MGTERSVNELFEHYYTELVSLLPMQDAKFLDDLCSHGLTPKQFKDEHRSLMQHNETAAYFLDHKIMPRLATGDTTNLFTLFTVMKNCDHDDVKDLAEKMERECKCKLYTSSYSIAIYSTCICINLTWLPYNTKLWR